MDRSLSSFKGYQDTLNKISSDIQNLEKFLKECNLNISCTYYTGYGTSDEAHFAISWEKTQGNEFRLMTRKYKFSQYDDDITFVDEPPKPLIEAPSEVRRKLWKHLPAFVDNFSKAISEETLEVSNEEDLPF